MGGASSRYSDGGGFGQWSRPSSSKTRYQERILRGTGRRKRASNKRRDGRKRRYGRMAENEKDFGRNPHAEAYTNMKDPRREGRPVCKPQTSKRRQNCQRKRSTQCFRSREVSFRVRTSCHAAQGGSKGGSRLTKPYLFFRSKEPKRSAPPQEREGL